MLSDERAVVTGASRGIGRAIAEGLVHNGAKVALVARSSEQLSEAESALNAERPGAARAFVADVRDPERTRAAIEAARDWLGAVTLLVNNAGTAGSAGAWWEDDPDRWWECVESIVRGAYKCTRAVLPGMLERGSGRVVAIASLTGTQAAAWGDATSTAKTALIRQTENLAEAAGAGGVVALALHPGLVETSLLDSYRRDPGVAAMLDGIPDEYYSPPSVAAEAVVRIAGGEFDAFAGRFLDATQLDGLVGAGERLDGDALRLRLAPLP